MLSQEVKLIQEVDKDSLRLHLVNQLQTSSEITITPVDSVKNDIRLRSHFYISKNDTLRNVISIPLKLIKDSVITDLKPFVSTFYDLGNPSEIHPDLKYPYAFPFPKGKKYQVSQTFNGKFSHRSEKSKFAIDFNLKIGDTVCAAREGIVIRIRENFKEHGGKEFINKANLIVIEHADGTFASYVHLDYKGALVAVGDTVYKGQAIGISGLTGFTRGPHLHFVVRKASSIAIPVYFENYPNKILKKGRKYKH